MHQMKKYTHHKTAIVQSCSVSKSPEIPGRS